MDRVPESAEEVQSYLTDEVLQDIRIEPSEWMRLEAYLNERHESLYGPYTTYFVLGSYERPFKFRLEMALGELNGHSSYAYLLAPEPNPDISDRLPELKLTFYLHALYADWIPLILEHNTGGALAEFGRLDQQPFFARTHVYPRGWDERYSDEPEDLGTLKARAIEIAYQADPEELNDRLGEIIEAAPDALPVVPNDIQTYLEDVFGEDHLPPDYSGVLTDGFIHFDEVGRSHSWTTVEELRNAIQELP